MDTSENIKTIKTDDVNREVSYMQTRRQDRKNEPLLPLRFAFLKKQVWAVSIDFIFITPFCSIFNL